MYIEVVQLFSNSNLIFSIFTIIGICVFSPDIILVIDNQEKKSMAVEFATLPPMHALCKAVNKVIK